MGRKEGKIGTLEDKIRRLPSEGRVLLGVGEKNKTTSIILLIELSLKNDAYSADLCFEIETRNSFA